MKNLETVSDTARPQRSVTWLALSLSLGYLALMATLMWMFEHAITLSKITDALENPGRVKSWSIIVLTAVVIFLVSQWALQRISRPQQRRTTVAGMGPDDVQSSGPGDGPGSWRDAILMLGMIGVLLIGTGAYIVLEQQTALDSARYRQFAIIGKMKANTAARWVDERQRDVRVLLENAGFVASLGRWMKGEARTEALREELEGELEAVVEANGFDGMVVLSPDGKVSLGVPENLTARKSCREAAADSAAPLARDVRLSYAFVGQNESPKLDAIGQVFDPDADGKRHFATLCLRIDLSQRLLPAISQWPGVARSGEILIGRADGEDVVVLNSPGATPAEQRTRRVKNGHALWQAALKATQAQGITEETFTGNVQKVLLVYPVQNSPWMVMVRMNRDEADQLQSRNQTYGTIVLGFVLLFIVMAFAIAWARTSSARSRVQAHRDRLLLELHELAYFDELTGLPGRRLITDRLAVALRDAERRSEMLGVLFLDLDRFKSVNDAFGHAAGDAVLRAVADRLRAVLRRNDSAGRLGGDEYLVVLPGNMDDQAVALLRDKIVHSIAQPVSWSGHMLEIGVSIGLAIYPRDGQSPQELMEKADTEMYADKQAQRQQGPAR